MRSIRAKWDAWRLKATKRRLLVAAAAINPRNRRYLPDAGEELSGFDKVRAVNNAVVIVDRLPRRYLRPLTRNGR